MPLFPSPAFSISITTFLMPVLKCEISITWSKLLFTFLRITKLHLQKNFSIWEAQQRPKKIAILIHLNFSFHFGFGHSHFTRFGHLCLARILEREKNPPYSCLEQFLSFPALIAVKD